MSNPHNPLRVVPSSPDQMTKPTDEQLVSFAKSEFDFEITTLELSSPAAAATKIMLTQAFEQKAEQKAREEAEQKAREEAEVFSRKLKELNNKLHTHLHPPKEPARQLSREEIEQIARENKESETPVAVILMEEMRAKFGTELPLFLFVANPEVVYRGAKVTVKGQPVEVKFEKPSDLIMAYRGNALRMLNEARELAASITDPMDKAALERHVEKVSTHVRSVSEIASSVFFVNFDKDHRQFNAPQLVFAFVKRLVAKTDLCDKVFTLPLIGKKREELELRQMKEREEAEKLHKQQREEAEKLRLELMNALQNAGCEAGALPKIVERLVKKFSGTPGERLVKQAVNKAVLSRTTSNEAEQQEAAKGAAMFARAAGLDALELEEMALSQIRENHSADGKKTPEVARKLSASEQREAAEKRRKERNAKKSGEKKGKKQK